MLEADERHSQSTQKYRESVAAEVFGNKLKEICGATGVEGDHPFVIKERVPAKGGDWTMARSIEERPKKAAALYSMGKTAIRMIQNKINPLKVPALGVGL